MTVSVAIKSPKKLIEVALPLDAINEAAAREKSIRFGIRELHLWWARRPLAAARAVIFTQMVNDPSWKWELEHPGEVPPNNIKASWAASRSRLFGLIKDIVRWENTANEAVMERARAEIRKSWRETCELNKAHPLASDLFDPEKLPAFHDPFAGGGALPLEAQRLGLEAYASDLNPIAVLINKAMIEIPPKFAGQPPVSPAARDDSDAWSRQWPGTQGLAEDVHRYGTWMREEAHKRIGHLYPKVEITAGVARERPDLKPYLGQKLTVVAWLWARTVKSPNPAFADVDVPLVSSFVLSPMEGREVYVEPVIEGRGYRFTVKVGELKDVKAATLGTTAGKRAAFLCLMSGTPIDYDHIRSQGRAGRMGARLMAIVAEGDRGRVYLSPTQEQEDLAASEKPDWRPETALPDNPRDFKTPNYGLMTFGDLFTDRQLVALSTFSDLVGEARERVYRDAVRAGLPDDGKQLREGGSGAAAYGDAVAVYLGFLVSKLADKGSSLCTWDAGPSSTRSASGRSARSATVRVTFGRQALPMTWDYAEVNFFSESVGGMETVLKTLSLPLSNLMPGKRAGIAQQGDAQSQELSKGAVVSTDPPYYDNIGYADLSDFFYVWLRRSLRPFLPDLFATLATPKAEELVATPYRHGGKDEAERFFLDGMTQAMHRLAEQAHAAFPVTIYYAFKQAETKGAEGTASTGWETFLDAVIRAGFAISGTWPMRTEMGSRLIGSGNNALASSIILVCRPRPATAETISRRAFQRELNQVLPEALDEMTRGSGEDRSPVAPVDLSQSIIGPGMAVFSKYAAVLEADGTPMTVRTALQLINRFLAEDDFDHDTQFCLHWFEQFGWKESRFGDADTLARAKGTSVEGVRQSGVLFAAGGVVRLLKWSEYPADWNPAADDRLPVWEVLHHIIRALRSNGETAAGEILASVAAKSEPTRQLAYRLYTLCERSSWSEDARAYNEVITSWNAIEEAATHSAAPRQSTLFDK
jgi:putative DNA methylase